MTVITSGNNRKTLVVGSQKINLREAKKEFEPKAHSPTAGSADLCFITSVPRADVIQHLQRCEIGVIEGLVKRTDAIGQMESVYFRDHDQNLIEMANYLV
jgi:hypothetical protein